MLQSKHPCFHAVSDLDAGSTNDANQAITLVQTQSNEINNTNPADSDAVQQDKQHSERRYKTPEDILLQSNIIGIT